jgi:hypothetical protein
MCPRPSPSWSYEEICDRIKRRPVKPQTRPVGPIQPLPIPDFAATVALAVRDEEYAIMDLDRVLSLGQQAPMAESVALGIVESTLPAPYLRQHLSPAVAAMTVNVVMGAANRTRSPVIAVCECGGHKTGARDFAPGHSPWCPVAG